jgi:pyruvate-ferredoxin/flavodoxin oxidoreductase
VALGPRALLEAGIDLAKARGVAADPLRMMIPKLAAKVTATIKAADPVPITLGEAISPAFEALLPKMAEERQPALRRAFEAVVRATGRLQIVRAAPFFDEPEAQSKGSGELLALAIDPRACKGCGLCSAVCEPLALVDRAREASGVATAEAQWKLWEALPDTAGETIARVRDHQDIGELAALLLSRHCLLALAGGDGAEAGSGARLALRQVLAVGEYQLQRSLQQLLQQVTKTRDELATQTRELVAEALPTDDVAALAAGLERVEKGSASVAELTGRLERVVEGGQVDVVRLSRLVDVGKEVADLHRRLSEGALGLGRARMGLVLAPDALTRGIGSFPYNPFQVPVVIDGGSQSVALARGLLDGQLRAAVDGFRVLRRARLELDNPAEAKLAEPRLQRLAFEELTAEERALCPPLWLVGEGFGDRALSDLLQSGLPIKVLLVGDAAEPLVDGRVGHRDPLALLGLGGRRAFVLQSSIAHPQQMFAEVSAALSYAGPAVIQLHAPSPTLHGFAENATVERARLAVESRAVPLFALDPTAEGVFGRRLRIEANPSPSESWCEVEEGVLTPAHWLLGDGRFAAHFTPVAGAEGAILPLAEYLALGPEMRQQHAPVVEHQGERLCVSPEVVAWVERCGHDWRTLQELGGLVTPFTARVQADVEQAVQQAHEQALAALKQEYEQRLAGSRDEQTAEVALRVRERLLALAGYGSSGEGSAS